MSRPKIRYPSIEAVADSMKNWKRGYPQIIDETFYFSGPWGRIDLTYGQYLMTRELRSAWINDKEWYRLVVGRRVYLYPFVYLKKHEQLRKRLNTIERQKKENPLQFFLPSGNNARAFLNNTTSSVKMLTAGNRFGKTATSIIDMLLDIVPCDPTWRIFTENGVEWRRHKPAQNWGCASYMWRQIMSTVAPLVIQWAPNDCLGQYSPDAGTRRRTVTDKKPWIEFNADIGALVNFFVYEQPQENFESSAHNGWVWDEQGEEAKFDGADERTRTCHGRHNFALTPHKVKGRMDTGAGTWLHRMWLGEYQKGHSVARYTADTFDNPEWNYPERDKVKARNKWYTEPLKHHDRKKLAEGRSRLHGEWHMSSGLVYDDLVEDIHIIEPFEVPDSWTRYRAVDHGDVNPTAAVYAVVNPNNEVFIVDEYYQAGRTVYENAKAIIEQCGNEINCTERRSDIGGNVEFDVYEEIEHNPYEWTKLDSRSFNSVGDTGTGRKNGAMYRDAGLFVTKAKGGDHTVKVPHLKQYLNVDYDKRHAITGEKGAPMVYIFSTVKMLRKELFSYRWMESKETESGESDPKPRKKDDHSVNAFEYLLMSNPVFRGLYTQSDLNKWHSGISLGEINKPRTAPARNKITGY